MWGERGHKSGSSPCVWLSSSALLAWQSSLPPQALPAADFLPPVTPAHLPTPNSSPRSGPLLQAPRTSSQPSCTPENTRPSPGHVGPRYGPSVYFPLCPICHRSAASPSSNGLKCFPSVLIDFPVERVFPQIRESLLCFSSPTPSVQVLSGPYWFSVILPGWSVHWCKWAVKLLYYYCVIAFDLNLSVLFPFLSQIT